ncbi:hypothetical protein PoB_000847800 [Plakobranchus ocellatus]|uniref:Reverse transcriptase domain-containing protein n=1 Tax=Plakobranchus ocellatus TaxID=259542 RepID=A0AAV3YHT2_9GAST|nr:hypothetical protein PoB_000847800 [Plakobranchus ocellatus]
MASKVSHCSRLEKTYNRVWRTDLQVRLEEHGIQAERMGGLQLFSRNALAYPDQVDPRPLADGLPQGSALRCTLFLIFMTNMRDAVRTSTRLSYANDFCERWKMQINTNKTAYTTFSFSNPVL